MNKTLDRNRGRSASQFAVSVIGIVLVLGTARWAWRTGADWDVLGAGLAIGVLSGLTDRLRFAPTGLPPRETTEERRNGWILTLVALGVLAALAWPFGYDNLAGFVVFFGPLTGVLWGARWLDRSRQGRLEE